MVENTNKATYLSCCPKLKLKKADKVISQKKKEMQGSRINFRRLTE